jgi:N-acetylglucosamine kinase-like BadF-type ATPase
VDGVIAVLRDSFDKLGVYNPDGGLKNSLIGFGVPAFGENRKDDEAAASEIRRSFPGAQIHFENDVYCAWAGAMAFSPGVTVVCGTGSMSVGCDSTGKLVRSGGWSIFFSDEGSGYWLGKKALEIFSKQSDGRLPRGALYNLMREHLKINDDVELNNISDTEYAVSRRKTATLQMVLFEAQKLGDESAKAVYEEAIREVVQIVLGSVRQLDFGDDVIDVSYIGGLWKEKELFLDPFIHELGKHIKANVFAPKLSPCHGAILFALKEYAVDMFDEVRYPKDLIRDEICEIKALE